MDITPKFYFYFAQILVILLGVAAIDKKLRNDRRLINYGVVTLLLGLVGLLIRSEETEMPTCNAADFLFGPFVFVVSYSVLRKIYISIYEVEPTYIWLRGYDWEDGRKVNLLDKIVHVLPLLLGMSFPFIVSAFE